MSQPLLPQSLLPLTAYLDSLTQRASVSKLRELLEDMDISCEQLSKFTQFNDTCYQRNLICEGPFYHLLAICWRSGQRSPIHNHAYSTCGLLVLEGVATETIFEHTPCGQVKAVFSHDLHTGHVCASQDADTHQVSNLQETGCDLVTLHIYSPPLLSMQMFSITGEESGVFTPMVAVHADGSGI